ncbi:MAG: aminoglycoside adenylyltransferase domain-containing protein [Chloroflexota bacterium]
MTQFGWTNCPDVIRRQVENFREGIVHILGDNLTGIYLHGSLAMGCFNPARSDLDMLVITRAELGDSARALAELVLKLSGDPSPVEISCLRASYLHPWQYPTPFDFHFSESWREKTTQALQTGQFGLWSGDPAPTDPDLAAHIIITRARGICLAGKPIDSVFPQVPRADYLHSILSDFDYARTHLGENPVYAVLNCCRIYGYVLEGRVDSKDEAGVWALESLPEYRLLIQIALDLYRGVASQAEFDPSELEHFAVDMQTLIKRSL